ncbi:hypothetical protein EDD36DRAFT_415227 [Exophiala viscosa]|uniref:Uncharacterized protein n=1 Tax=Exophiala viscosa TaxID=2486360 RepID=A0AAN6E3B3_9EURO|nr:hypothetical protein EDD36DRAFT_415227 [Exophiala viscosa]
MHDKEALCLYSPKMFDVAVLPKFAPMEGYQLFQDALIMPLDLDQNHSSDAYLFSEYDDNTTLSTAGSPSTPSSEIATLSPSWSFLPKERGMDLSSWDATPDWIKRRSPRSYDLDDGILGRKKRRHLDEPHDLVVASVEPHEARPNNSGTPFRFVEITPDNILSGEVHRAKGEWKRGRPRRKSASNAKSKVAITTGGQCGMDRIDTEPSGQPTTSYGQTAARHEPSLFQPVFDQLLVTEQERDFFAGLFAPSFLD